MNSGNCAQLNALFVDDERPTILDCMVSAEKALIKLHIPAGLSWFEGHFPEQKVLPGIVQINWVGKFAKALLLNNKAFSQLTNIKFKTMLLPDVTVNLELQYVDDKQQVKFHFFNDVDSFSTGSLKFITP